MTRSLLVWLEKWYSSQCDGEWEQEKGISIETLDNPGWQVTINVSGRNAGSVLNQTIVVLGDPPNKQNGNMGGNDWMICEIENGKFSGAGDPMKLEQIIERFRAWVEK